MPNWQAVARVPVYKMSVIISPLLLLRQRLVLFIHDGFNYGQTNNSSDKCRWSCIAVSLCHLYVQMHSRKFSCILMLSESIKMEIHRRLMALAVTFFYFVNSSYHIFSPERHSNGVHTAFASCFIDFKTRSG